MLAYTPFIDPISTLWPGAYHSALFVNVFCLVWVSVLTSVAYKAVRWSDFSGPLGDVLAAFARQVLIMTVQIVLGVWALGLLIHLLVQHIVPLIAPI